MAKIYRKRGNKLNEVVTFDSACTRQENQPLVYDATDGSVHTTTHIGCLNADDVSVGNLTVTGQAIIQEQVTDTIDSNTLVLRSNADAGLTGTENSGVIIHNYNGSEDLYAVTDNTGTFRVGTAASTTTTYAYLRYNKTDNKWYSTAPGVTPAVEVTPAGSPTSWGSVVTSGDDAEYTNIIFSVIDRTSLEPLTTRDESTAMEADYLTKWNSTDEKIITTGTSCTHDLCANGDITSTGDITADGNVCVKTNLTVDGNSCVSGDSTVSGEIHSCKCITAPTACVSDDLYVAGDINNCNEDSIFHGSYGCFEKNVCIKGDLAIDGTIAVSSLTSDHVISVENTTNSSFYLPFVGANHLVAGSNDLYTNGDLQYNPSTDVLCTKTFCSDRGIVQSAITGVTAADLGLTANTVYSLSTIVSCLQACCGDKAVSYSFNYADATTPKVTEYGQNYAYNLTFEKLDNKGFSSTYAKSRWLVTGANGVSWTVTGTTGSTVGNITWTVCEHVVDQVCVATVNNNQDYPLIFSTYQSTPSSYFKKTLYNDSRNDLMYNPSTNTLNACCINANTSLSQGNLSYKYCFKKNDNSGRTTLLVLRDISCAVCCSSCGIGIVGRVCDSRTPAEGASSSIIEDVNFYIKANYGAKGSSAMDIKYYGYGEDQLRPVIITRNDNKVYAAMCISGSMRFLSFDTIGACSVINEVCVDANGVYKDSSGCTYAITKAGDLATLCVNASSSNVWTADQNTNYPIVFSTCQKTPTIGCKTLYNDSANNLMYNPGTNTLTTGTICGITKITEGNPTGCTSSVAGQPGSTLQSGVLELYSCTPAVDFHVNNAGADYSHRIIACTDYLRIIATNATGSTAATKQACYDFYSDGIFYSLTGVRTGWIYAPPLNTPNSVADINFRATCCNASSFQFYCMCLCGSNGILYNPQGISTDKACSNYTVYPYTARPISANIDNNTYLGGTGTTGSKIFLATSLMDTGKPMSDGFITQYYWDSAGWNAQLYIPNDNNAHMQFRCECAGVWCCWNQLIDSTGGQTIAGNLTVHNSSNNAVLCADCFKSTYSNVKKWITRYEPLACCIGLTPRCTYTTVCVMNCLFSCYPHISQGDSIRFAHAYACSALMRLPDGRAYDLSGGSITRCSTNWSGSYGIVQASVTGGWLYLCAPAVATPTDYSELPYLGPVETTSLKVCDMAIDSSTFTPISLTCGSYKARIDNYDNIVIGCATSTSGSGNIAIGKTVCASSYSVAIGATTKALSSNSIAIGCGSIACDSSTIALGTKAHAKGDGAVSIGSNASASTGFLALGKWATSDVAIDTTMAGNPMFPYSSIIEMDDIKYGRHGRIKFVIPSCSKNIDITSFFNSLFISEINRGRCKNTWSTSSSENIPTLVAHLSGFYWDDGGSSDNYQRWAPGINGRGNINELILLNTSAAASSNLSVYDLIVSCGKNICTTSWNWGKGTNVWTCGMVGVIEF